MTAPLWATPFNAGWSDCGQVDSTELTTGETWTGSAIGDGTFENGGSYFTYYYKSGVVISYGSYDTPIPHGVADYPTGNLTYSGGFNVSIGWPWIGPEDMSRYSFTGTGFLSTGYVGGGENYSIPDWRGQPGCPKKVAIKGMRLVPHVKGGPWVPVAPTLVGLPDVDEGTELNINYGGYMPGVDISDMKATFYVVAADFNFGYTDTLTNVTILKKLTYDASVGNVVADIPSDVPSDGPPEPGAFYFGYTAWDQWSYKSGEQAPIVLPTEYNIFQQDSDAGRYYWYEEPGPPVSVYATEWKPPEPGGDSTGSSTPYPLPADLTYAAVGIEDVLVGSIGSAEPTVIHVSVEPFDVDIEIDYEQCAGRSVFIVYPAAIPVTGDDGGVFYVGFDATANTDAMSAYGLGGTAGQLQVEIPPAYCKTTEPITSQDLDDSPVVNTVTMQGTYFLPVVDGLLEPQSLCNANGQPQYFGPDTDFGVFALYFDWVGPGLGGVQTVSLGGIGSTESTANGLVWDVAIVAQGGEEYELGDGGYWTDWQSGVTYHYRMRLVYYSIDDDVGAFWDPNNTDINHEDDTGPFTQHTLTGDWVPFSFPVPPTSTVKAGKPTSGIVPATRRGY